MDSRFWIQKALSMCLIVAMIATYSMVTLANAEKIAGELTVGGDMANGQASFVKVNGEKAESGLSIFSNSTIATPDGANAIINLGKVGKIELAPNTIMTVSFDDKGISGDLATGRVTVLSASDTVTVKMSEGKTVKLHSGESAADNKSAKDDDDDKDDNGGGRHGSSFALYALIFGGAIAGLLIAVFRSKNRIVLGGGSVIVSSNR